MKLTQLKSSNFDRIQVKIKRFKQHFKGWGYKTQGEKRKIKLQMQERLLVLEQLEENSLLTLEQTQGHKSKVPCSNTWKKKNFIGSKDLVKNGFMRGIIFTKLLMAGEGRKTFSPCLKETM